MANIFLVSALLSFCVFSQLSILVSGSHDATEKQKEASGFLKYRLLCCKYWGPRGQADAIRVWFSCPHPPLPFQVWGQERPLPSRMSLTSYTAFCVLWLASQRSCKFHCGEGSRRHLVSQPRWTSWRARAAHGVPSMKEARREWELSHLHEKRMNGTFQRSTGSWFHLELIWFSITEPKTATETKFNDKETACLNRWTQFEPSVLRLTSPLSLQWPQVFQPSPSPLSFDTLAELLSPHTSRFCRKSNHPRCLNLPGNYIFWALLALISPTGFSVFPAANCSLFSVPWTPISSFIPLMPH